MNGDIDSIVFMVLITCTALIGAVNSRGTARIVISYILAFVCLALTAFNTTKYFAQASEQKTQTIVENVQSVLEEKAAQEAEAAAAAAEAAAAEAVASQATEEETKYKSSAKSIASKALKLSRKLNGYKVEAGSDEEYEELVKKAGYYQGEARKYVSRVKKLSAPASLSNSHKKLQTAVGVLSSATTHLRRYYNAENEEEEEGLKQSFKAKIKQAQSLLNNANNSFE